MTQEWTEVNNGHRKLKGKVPDWPADIFMDIALNGKIVDTWDINKLNEKNVQLAYNEVFFKLFDDENFIKSEEGEPVEFAIRTRSVSDPRMAGLSVAHLYYA